MAALQNVTFPPGMLIIHAQRSSIRGNMYKLKTNTVDGGSSFPNEEQDIKRKPFLTALLNKISIPIQESGPFALFFSSL